MEIAQARALKDPIRNAQDLGQQAMANFSLTAALQLAVLVFRPRAP